MIGLVNLVFDVFFYTIYGLKRSTKGFPMGGHASRYALDVDLVRSEIEVLACLVLDSSRILKTGRMVDDVAVVLQGSYNDMIRISTKKPECMYVCVSVCGHFLNEIVRFKLVYLSLP